MKSGSPTSILKSFFIVRYYDRHSRNQFLCPYMKRACAESKPLALVSLLFDIGYFTSANLFAGIGPRRDQKGHAVATQTENALCPMFGTPLVLFAASTDGTVLSNSFSIIERARAESNPLASSVSPSSPFLCSASLYTLSTRERTD